MLVAHLYVLPTDLCLGSPSLICLDEPTSGLDSTAANSLVQTLRDLADSGKTVIAVIHQPNQHVFSKFDDILLVSEGKQMYFGPRQEVRSYMESSGCSALPEMGTSEHILDCISRHPIGDEAEIEVNDRMELFSKKAREITVNLGEILGDSKEYQATSRSGPRASVFVQFRLLLSRSLREVFRGKVTIMLGLVRQISTALIFGGIYNLGTNQASIQDRFGLLSLIAIGAMNMAVAQTIRTFPREKSIVANELASNMYRTLPYFVGKAISEIPMVGFFNGIFGFIVYKLTGLSSLPGKLFNFLGLLTVHGILSQSAGLLIGSISPNSDVALAIFPAVVVLNIIFDVSIVITDTNSIF
jgi:ABC-2 type transporter